MCLKEALRKLSPMISEQRRIRIASVVASRTNSIAILLDNVYNDANQNAILRSMDALGCLYLHSLQTEAAASLEGGGLTKRRLRYPPRTDAGARSWVNTHQWHDVTECIAYLKSRHGYTLACALPTATSTPVTSIDFGKKLLVAFGNERDGISRELADLSEINFSLPMCGFVESYNVSVSVALVLFQAYLHRAKAHVRRSSHIIMAIVWKGGWAQTQPILFQSAQVC